MRIRFIEYKNTQETVQFQNQDNCMYRAYVGQRGSCLWVVHQRHRKESCSRISKQTKKDDVRKSCDREKKLQKKVHEFAPKLKNISEQYRQTLKSTDFSKIECDLNSVEAQTAVNQLVQISSQTPHEVIPQEDGFVTIEGNFSTPLWTKEILQELEEVPFGKFLAAEILSKQENTHHKEKLQNALATMSLDGSIHHDLINLQEKINQRTQTIDLSAIDEDKEWNIVPQKLDPKFKGYAWKSKIINPSKKHNGVIVFLLIHGTFVDYTEFGKNNDTQLTKDLIHDAKIMADQNDCAVKVISFNWSGELDM